METLAQGDRGGGEDRARHHQRLSPSASPAAIYLDIEPDRDGAGALRPDGRRPAGRDRHRARRRDGHHHGGRAASASASSCAIRANCAHDPQQHRHARCWCRPWTARMIPLGQLAQVSLSQGRARHPHRERAARRPTSTSTSATATSAATWPTRSKAVARAGQIPARLLRHLERPVRVHGARHREDEDRRPADAADHLPAALPQLQARSPKR